MTARLADQLLDRAVGWRQGVVSRVDPTPLTKSDVDVAGFAAVPDPSSRGGTSGGAGRDPRRARAAAIAEALERHAAACCPLETTAEPTGPTWSPAEFTLHSEQQRATPGFRYPGYREPLYTKAWTLPGNTGVQVPAGLVTLADGHGLPATSSGLAAEASPIAALLRATQELVERDAFSTTWLHSLPARQVALPDSLLAPVAALGGRITAYDLTPAYSPHPVAAVAGTLPLGGMLRPTLGLACRASWAQALDKAWIEWCQGTVFVGVHLAGETPGPASPGEVTDFDQHAVHYAGHLDHWRDLPMWQGEQRPAPADSAAAGSGAAAELTELVTAVDSAGLRLAYRDLTTPELRAVGLHAVRVLSPDLTPLHADHRWPHLGGRAAELSWRYPDLPPGRFPNPFPHPLG